MNDYFKEFKTLKLKLINNNRICIENYKKLNTMTDEIMIIDNYHISGSNLSIVTLDAYLIVIEGKITKLEILC